MYLLVSQWQFCLQLLNYLSYYIHNYNILVKFKFQRFFQSQTSKMEGFTYQWLCSIGAYFKANDNFVIKITTTQ